MIALVLALGLAANPASPQPSKVAADGGARHAIEPIADAKSFQALPAFHARGTHVIHFWASWCEPCRDELPEFLAKARELAQHGVDFTFISVDSPDDLDAVAAPLLEQLDAFFPGAHQYALSDAVSPDLVTAKLSRAWGGEIPATFVFRDGKKTGEFHGAAEDHALDGLATSPAPRSSSRAPRPSR